jgi:hypothetical protein
MYQHRSSRPSAASSSKPLSIRLQPIPVNEKAAYVETVCSLLIDSRFGPGRSTAILTDLRKLPEQEAAVFYDLTVDGPVPSYTILPDSEIARRHAHEIIIRELERSSIAAASNRGQTLSPSTLGRGSPKLPVTPQPGML